jgi:hypothetical protein
MSIEEQPVSNAYDDTWADTWVILWFWKDKPGGGIADWFVERHIAENALFVLQTHGDPSKEFKLEVL